MPIDPARIPAEKIIEFRQTYAEERDQFQVEVAGLTGAFAYLRDVNDPHEVEQHLQSEYDKTLAPRLAALRKGLNSANIDTADSAMAVSFALPASVTAILRRWARRLLHRVGGLRASPLQRGRSSASARNRWRFAEAVTRGISLPGFQTIDAQDRHEGDLRQQPQVPVEADRSEESPGRAGDGSKGVTAGDIRYRSLPAG